MRGTARGNNWRSLPNPEGVDVAHSSRRTKFIVMRQGYYPFRVPLCRRVLGARCPGYSIAPAATLNLCSALPTPL